MNAAKWKQVSDVARKVSAGEIKGDKVAAFVATNEIDLQLTLEIIGVEITDQEIADKIAASTKDAKETGKYNGVPINV